MMLGTWTNRLHVKIITLKVGSKKHGLCVRDSFQFADFLIYLCVYSYIKKTTQIMLFENRNCLVENKYVVLFSQWVNVQATQSLISAKKVSPFSMNFGARLEPLFSLACAHKLLRWGGPKLK